MGGGIIDFKVVLGSTCVLLRSYENSKLNNGNAKRPEKEFCEPSKFPLLPHPLPPPPFILHPQYPETAKPKAVD
jgi:hypothetical protein